MTLLCLLVTLLPPISGDANWPAFLGSGASQPDVADLPLKWSPKKGVEWIAEIEGHGQSSPVLWGDKVFVTSVSGKEKEQYHLSCINAQSGEPQWSASVTNSDPAANSYYVSRAAPTPIVDANRVIAFFESGDCVCFAHDGEKRWQRNIATEVGKVSAEFGLGASPCQTAETMFVLIEHDEPGSLIAINKQTGNTLWKVDRPAGRSWSSPAIVAVAGAPHVVVSSSGSVLGFSPKTGKQLWQLDEIGGNTGCTPIDCGDGRFLVGASPGRNGENAGSAAQSNCLVQISSGNDGFEATKVWVAERAFPSWASPIIHEGFAYWVNRSGVVFCFDVTTGQSVYQQRLKQSCWATPFGIGDRIYFFGKDGLTTVIAAGAEFKVLSENTTWGKDDLPAEAPLGEEATEERRRASAMFSKPTLYGYAVSADAFYVRVGNALICCREGTE
ncbi:MAG TPA: pyrrolo-quinoline quinone [Planctomycetaceae bacterium]|nr:pyrrolo-quinoline quinone [Planctomycetaceae bacterium]